MSVKRSRYVIIIATCDTKGSEVSHLRGLLEERGLQVRVADVGLNVKPQCQVDFTREQITGKPSEEIALLLAGEGGKPAAMEVVARGAGDLIDEKIAMGEAAGVIALGGGVGTWIGLRIMRRLPFGFPKIMISTLPFDIRPDLGAGDVMIVPSVADILGLNPILRRVLQNAAGAMAGMVDLEPLREGDKEVIGITALGVTTPLVNRCKEILEDRGFEIAAFHGVGIGGKTYEEWVGTGLFAGVLDVTPHDINNFLFHGISPPYQGRLESAARRNIPQVVAPGGLDFISRGPIDELSDEDRRKKHYQHSPKFTHVRVSAAEMETVARVVAAKLNLARKTTSVVIPMRGFSHEGHARGRLADQKSDMTLVRLLKQLLHPEIPIIEVDAHVNDASFAEAVCREVVELIASKR
jgi:uncharacterized protein (UPF0261 family)